MTLYNEVINTNEPAFVGIKEGDKTIRALKVHGHNKAETIKSLRDVVRHYKKTVSKGPFELTFMTILQNPRIINGKKCWTIGFDFRYDVGDDYVGKFSEYYDKFGKELEMIKNAPVAH